MRVFLLASGIVSLVACRSAVPDRPVEPSAVDESVTPQATSPGVLEGEPSPAAEATSIGRAEEIFGDAVFQAVAGGASKNLAISPQSISVALHLAAAGAAGDTREEMFHTLGTASLGGEVFPSMRAVAASLSADAASAGITYEAANRVWSDEQFEPSLRPEYRQTVEDFFAGGFATLNFVLDPEAARREINQWVSDRTREKIPELLPSGTITPESRVVLTNAVYFLADWSIPFSKESTWDQAFHLDSGEEIQVPMMHNTSSFRILDGDKFASVVLPYVGGQFEMVAIVPNPGELETVRAQWIEALHQTVENAAPARVALTMPKFRTRWNASLVEALQDAGMELAFTDFADFSGMCDGSRGGLAISDVIHETFVQVDEKGTEAAAATAVVMRTLSAAFDEEMPRPFEIDRPFLYIIRHAPTDSVLFLGLMHNPAVE
jgi:serpin B